MFGIHAPLLIGGEPEVVVGSERTKAPQNTAPLHGINTTPSLHPIPNPSLSLDSFTHGPPVAACGLPVAGGTGGCRGSNRRGHPGHRRRSCRCWPPVASVSQSERVPLNALRKGAEREAADLLQLLLLWRRRRLLLRVGWCAALRTTGLQGAEGPSQGAREPRVVCKTQVQQSLSAQSPHVVVGALGSVAHCRVCG